MKIADQYGSPDERYSYKSALIERLRKERAPLVQGRLTIELAEKLGFCWGVDRAVAMVWDAIRRNPGRRIWLIDQIIHNPQVNRDFLAQGVQFVFGRYAQPGGFDRVQREDLVMIPAFSAEVEHLQRVRQIGCEVLDTTCPWVEKPHRRVHKYIEDGFTTLIHGLLGHAETRATCSLVDSKGGKWLVLRGHDECDCLCAFLRGEQSASETAARLAASASKGFDFTRDLEKVGMVNQTTMLASESREIAERVAEAMRRRELARRSAGKPPVPISCTAPPKSSSETSPAPGAVPVASAPSSPFRDFDTICPATQDNQDAVIELTGTSPPDLFLVIGGFDSSNTANLLRAARARRGVFHVQDPTAIGSDSIRHRDPSTGREVEARGWLPSGPLRVALSAGASTPDTELAEVIRRICLAAGERAPDEAAVAV